MEENSSEPEGALKLYVAYSSWETSILLLTSHKQIFTVGVNSDITYPIACLTDMY